MQLKRTAIQQNWSISFINCENGTTKENTLSTVFHILASYSYVTHKIYLRIKIPSKAKLKLTVLQMYLDYRFGNSHPFGGGNWFERSENSFEMGSLN